MESADKACPVEKGVEFHLQSHDASGCILAGLTALSWVKKNSSSFPPRLTKVLLGALSKPKADRLQNGSLQIYSELWPQYEQAQGAVANFLKEVSSLLKYLFGQDTVTAWHKEADGNKFSKVCARPFDKPAK